jgi:hypothetical protein
VRGDEERVVRAFCAWLRQHGWTVEREVKYTDVVARRGDERLYAEAKGRTAAIGLDVDTLYGVGMRQPAGGSPGAVRISAAAARGGRDGVRARQRRPASASAGPARTA